MAFNAAGSSAGAGLGGSLGGLAGGIAGLAMGGGGKDQLKLALKAIQDVKTSNFDFRELPAPVLRILAEQVPEIFEATTPEEFQQIEDSVAGRAAQIDAIGQLGQYSEEGMPLADRLNQADNARSVQDASAGAQDAALRALGAKGALGAGDEIQARLAGNQTASNLARDLARDSAKEAATRRLSATGMLGQQGTAVRASDVDVSGQKAAIANRFKELFANTMNQSGQYNAGARERAQATNVANKQRVGEENTTNQYGVSLENLNRKNRLKGDVFQQDLGKANALAGAYGDLADWEDAKRAEKIGNISSVAGGIGGIGGSIGGGFI